MKKPEIPHNEISKGIKMCIENSQRLHTDALVLRDGKKYHSAIVNVILASEELAKGILLYAYYKKGESVPSNKVEQYFSLHGIRLKEFSDFFHKNLPGLSTELAEEFSERFWNMPRTDREKLIYVDWTNKGWIDPKDAILSLPGDEDKFAELRFKMYELNFRHVLSTLLRNQDFRLDVAQDETKISLGPSQSTEIIPALTELDYVILEGNNLDNLEVSIGDGKNYQVIEPEKIQKSSQHKKIIKISGVGMGFTRYKISNLSGSTKTFVCKIITVQSKQNKD